MSKYYGVNGKKVGKIGGEKYYIDKGDNIVQKSNKYYPVNSTLIKREKFKEYVLSLFDIGIPQIYVLEELPEDLYPYALIFIQNEEETSIYVDKEEKRTKINIESEEKYDAVDIVNEVPEEPRDNTVYFVNDEQVNKNKKENENLDCDIYVCDNNELRKVTIKDPDVDLIKEVIEEIKTKSLANVYNANLAINELVSTDGEGKLKASGINRLSIGLQTTNDKMLKKIGRIHTYEDFLDTYIEARKAGFKNINVDLMLALPEQTLDEVMDSAKRIVNLNPEHISIYSLILEEGTPLYEKAKSGKLKLVDEDIERRMYWETNNLFRRYGYNHYEISNYSKSGYESKHNVNCWKQEEYIGFGLNAHSYFNGKRYTNTPDIDEYIKNINAKKYSKNIIVEEENREKEQIMKEYMMLGLRRIEGVSISEFQRKFATNPLFYFSIQMDALQKKELIEVDLDNIKLTKKGLDFANIVFQEFV